MLGRTYNPQSGGGEDLMQAETRFRLDAPNVIAETIEGEAIMINLGTGNYYSVRGSGADVCAMLDGGASSEEIVDALLLRYDGERATVAAAVEELLRDLEAEKLVARTDDGVLLGRLPENGDQARIAFVPPTLEKYTDMQDLVLLDPVHEVDERGWPHAGPAAGTDGG